MNLLRAIAIASILIICAPKTFSQNSPEKVDFIFNEILNINETQGLGVGDNNIALINNSGKLEWEYDFHQKIKGAGKFHGNIVVFFLKKGDLCASTVDIKKGTVLDEKVVHPKINYKQVIVHNNPVTNNFENLLIRTMSGLTGIILSGKTDVKMPTGSKEIKLVTLSPSLEAVTKDLPSIAINNAFVGSSAGNDGHFFIASIVNSSLVIEYFNNEVLEHKLEKALNCSKKIDFDGLVRTDIFAGNSVLVNLKYRNADRDDQFSYFNFNFDNKQVTVADEAPLNNKSPYEFKHKDDLTPDGIFFTKDRIVFVKEVRYLGLTTSLSQSSPNHTPTFNESAVVTVFDRQLKLLHDIVLEKKSSMSSTFISRIGCHIQSNNLYIASHEGPQLGKHEDFCYTINVDNGKWDKKKLDSKPGGSRYVYGFATLWFANEIILSYLSGFSPGSPGAILVKLNYTDL